MQSLKNYKYRDNEGRLIIGTTIIKAFRDNDHCPAKLKAIYIDELQESKPTDSMLKGLFFETLVMGS